MTYQEIYDYLLEKYRTSKSNYMIYCSGKIMSMILSAVQKQIPKSSFDKYTHKGKTIGKCPNCAYTIIDDQYPNCPYCGQKLKRGD